MKNLYPSYLIDKDIKKLLENKFTTKENTNIPILIITRKTFITTNYHTLILIQIVPRKKL